MADYRDDAHRQALRERVTILQQEIDSLHEKLRVLDEEERRRKKPRATTAVVLPNHHRALLFAGGIVVLGIGIALAARRPAAPPPPIAVPVPVASATETAIVTPTPALATEPRAVKATWPARVRLSTGTAAAQTTASAACSIDVHVAEQGNLPSLRDLAVRCGEHVLYDSTKPSAGMRQSSALVRQVAGKDRGTLVFDVNYTDTGTGDAPQIRVDGSKGTAFLWHDYPDAFRIELAFARPSSPVTAEPLGALGVAALDRTARVRQVRGRAVPTAGTMCTVHAMPEGGRSCFVSVDCGPGGALFGAIPFSATATCNATEVAKGRARILDLDDPNGSAESATGGDPRLNMFTPPGRLPTDAAPDVLTVADEPKNGAPWSVELALVDVGAGIDRPAK